MSTFKVYSDGASRGNPGAAGAGFVVYNAAGEEVHRNSTPLGIVTNNVAEYTALIEAAKYVQSLKPEHVDFFLDSELIVRQVSGAYKVKSEHLLPMFKELQGLLKGLDYTCSHVRREQNKVADMLANIGADMVK